MGANPAGPIELAMTHFADGRACQRPSEVRAIASRLMGWRGDPETCKSCLAAEARSIIGGEPLCPLCREQRAVRTVGPADLDRRSEVIREAPASAQALRGHPIVFDSWSLDLGGFIERVRPQAANRIVTDSADVRMLWNHNSDIPLARSAARTMAYWKDATGVVMHAIPPTWASNHIESVQRGDVTAMSFGFRMIEDEWYVDGNKPKRDLLDMTVSEFSAVAFPAYPATDVAVTTTANRVAWLEKWNRNRAVR